MILLVLTCEATSLQVSPVTIDIPPSGASAVVTLPVARDLASDGIRVCAIVPPDPAGGARHSRSDEFARLVVHALTTPGLTGEIVRPAKGE